MLRIVCACGRAFKAEDRHTGKRTKCPACGAGLTIGPTPVPSSSGNDVDEVPAWWYPSDPATHATRGIAPTRSGSDPDREAVDTVVFPAGYDASPKPPASSQSPSAVASTTPQAFPPKTPVGAQVRVPAHASFPVKKLWAIASGTVGFLVLAIGAILWLRSAPPGVNEVSLPREAEPDTRDRLDPSRLSPPSTPGGNSNPSESRVASKSNTDPSPSGPQIDIADPPRASPASASRRLRMLVPAYIYPTGEGRKEWRRLIDAASKVEIVAIANPNSGPGNERDLDYAAIFTEASNQGVTLVGYVATNYGARPQAEIRNDVDTWIRFYPQIRGFFFDQQPRERHDAGHFAELRDYVKRKIRDPLVITNPGVPCDEAYLAQAVSNVTCIFVNFQGFDQFDLPATLHAYGPSRFAATPYNIPDVETMRKVVKEAIIKRIGYLYISDAKPPNHWGKLPAYWEAEVEAISRVR
jgi:Spherulation-specific family 4